MITISEGSVEYFQNRLDFPSEGGSKTVQFSTNKTWEISVSESGMGVDWCAVTPKSGTAGDVTLTISVPENTSYGERSVILTLTAGDATEKLRVSQKQNDAILVSSTLFEVPMEGGEIEIEVKSNVNYQVEIPEQFSGWIHKGTKTRALESNNLSFVVDGNEDYEKREGEIVISDGNITEVVKVYQAGGGILVLSKNEYNVPSNGGTVTVDLSSNFEYNFELPNVDWIKLNDGTRGMSSHTIHFDILPNESYDNRSANIRFYDPSGTVSDIVTINQAQKDALIISNKEYTVDSNQNYISIDINTNIEYEVEIPETCASWIRQAENRLTRALNPYKLDFVISENNTYDKREGTIIVKGIGKDISETVSIEQMQNDAIFIDSAKDVNISYEGGIVNVDVNSNVDIELEFLQGWTHVSKETRGLVKSSHSFAVDENDTPYERTGKVIVKKLNSSLPTDTMQIHQEKGFLTLEVTPGNLSKQLSEYSDVTVEMLRLSGSLNVQDYLTLREIKTLWNLDLSNLTDKTMPRQAFMNVENITEIKLPNLLEEIPDELFLMTNESRGLTCSLTVPLHVKKIGKSAFYHTNLSEVIISDSVEEIGDFAFSSLFYIKRLSIGDGVKRLGNKCFSHLSYHIVNLPGNYTELEYLRLGKNIEWMEGSTFEYCNYNGTFVVPDKVNTLDVASLRGSNFYSIVLSPALTSLGEWSLDNLTNLKSVYCKSEIPPTFKYNSTISGTPMLYLGVPIGSKAAYEQVEPWKNFMVIEEIDYDTFVIPGTESN